MPRSMRIGGLSLVLATAFGVAGHSQPGAPQGRAADQEALRAYAGLVGPWKGTGQPQRNNVRGAWVETGQWAWSLKSDSAALQLQIEKGKYLKSALLRPAKKPGGFVLAATLADGSLRNFAGTASKEASHRLVMTAEEDKGEGLRRITLTPLHDTRFLMLLEARGADSDQYQRLAEVGFTRQGVPFAAGESYPVCIVTGGRGTTQVTYKGQVYWVCCSGCKDLFNEDPKAILADAEARKQAGAK